MLVRCGAFGKGTHYNNYEAPIDFRTARSIQTPRAAPCRARQMSGQNKSDRPILPRNLKAEIAVRLACIRHSDAKPDAPTPVISSI
jgi:hypothetical protein